MRHSAQPAVISVASHKASQPRRDIWERIHLEEMKRESRGIYSPKRTGHFNDVSMTERGWIAV